MTCCSPLCKKITIFSVATIFLVLGLLAVFAWTGLFNKILREELSLRNRDTIAYSQWQKTPIPMFAEFYLFNWTNPEEVVQQHAKPKFVQMGPYVYSEVHVKENVTFNDNNTITFLNNRFWQFSESKSNGAPTDKITNINTIAATVAFIVRDKHYLVKRGVNFFFEEKNINLTVTKTVSELLFDGYDDPLLDLVRKLNISGVDIKMKKFGWFSERNGSSIYDGVFNMYNGADDIEKLGKLAAWDYSDRTTVYPGTCGRVIGTTGEQWYPIKDDRYISVFATDLCSTVKLNRSEVVTKHGLDGYKYVGDESVFDNGTHYPQMSCFVTGHLPNGTNLPSGVRNVSQCKFGAPAFVSYPHFYLADSYYTDSIEGMRPNKSKHEFFISLEPNTGIPLEVSASVQINIMVPKTEGINMFQNFNTTFMPTMWFRQKAELTEALASEAKLLLTLPAIGTNTGYGFIGIAGLLFVVGIFITIRNGWRGYYMSAVRKFCSLFYTGCNSTACHQQRGLVLDQNKKKCLVKFCPRFIRFQGSQGYICQEQKLINNYSINKDNIVKFRVMYGLTIRCSLPTHCISTTSSGVVTGYCCDLMKKYDGTD